MLLLLEKPFYTFINTACLTVSAMGLTALIQKARNEISSYHLALAHHITLTMLPVIMGVAAQLPWIRQRQSTIDSNGDGDGERKRMPWSTMLLCIVAFLFIFGVMGSVLALRNRCSFDGHYQMGPDSLPLIVWLGLGIYILGWVTSLSLKRDRFHLCSIDLKDWLAVVCQLAVLAATGGLIYFVEKNVLFAQGFLVGGTENNWAFGQILAMISVIVPVMEMLQHGASHSQGSDRNRFICCLKRARERMNSVFRRMGLGKHNKRALDIQLQRLPTIPTVMFTEDDQRAVLLKNTEP